MKKLIIITQLVILVLSSCTKKETEQTTNTVKKEIKDETNYFHPTKDTTIYASDNKADYGGDAWVGHLDIEPYKSGSVIKVGIQNHWVAAYGKYQDVTKKQFFVKQKLGEISKVDENFSIDIDGKKCKFILTLR